MAGLLEPRWAIVAAFTTVAALGVLHYSFSVEPWFAVLYTLPIGLAAWSAGRAGGAAASALAVATWIAASRAAHDPGAGHPYWDGFVVAATLLLFAELVARLRAARVASDQRFLRVLDGLPDALYVTDATRRVLYANRRFVRLLGSGAPTAESDVAARFVPVKVQKDSASGVFGANCIEVRDVSGGRRYSLQTTDIPWVDFSRAQLHVLTDITDRTIAQGLRAEAHAAVRHTTRISDMTETASILAHELNQPLVALVGYNTACIRLLEAADLDRGALTAALEKSRAQAVRAGEIVHRMRELARRRAPRFAQCEVNALVREQVALSEQELARAGIELEVALAEPAKTLEADPVLVAQVLRNLVDNAVDAMWDCPRGARRLRLETRQLPEGGMRVTVADRGHGVAPDVAESMFRPFFTTRNTGLGLGLAICRSIAEAHGGRLWHEARPDGGTAFHLTLPSDVQ